MGIKKKKGVRKLTNNCIATGKNKGRKPNVATQVFPKQSPVYGH